MLLPLLLATPWLALLAFLAFRVRLPRELPQAVSEGGPFVSAPSVSVVVPARDEALNIEACVRSLAESSYPDFEILVVDDRSGDGTAALARAVPKGNASRLLVIDGVELPDGWLGKPWACHQGAERAKGDLILFTDADTIHAPDLLGRAVAALEEDEADLLSVAGRQLMETFWERLVQPQFFFVMAVRFYDIADTLRRGRWRDAIANGQFMLFRREVYDAVGGHAAVKDEVVEDLSLAQLVVRRGRRLSFRTAETGLATRMYRSLGHLIEGWSKNMFRAGLQTVPPWLRPVVAPVSSVVGFALWLAPPLVLLRSLAWFLSGGAVLPVLVWSAAAVAFSTVIWVAVSVRMDAPFWYGFLYPVGAAVGQFILLRSWARGRNVVWKGRAYRLRDIAETP